MPSPTVRVSDELEAQGLYSAPECFGLATAHGLLPHVHRTVLGVEPRGSLVLGKPPPWSAICSPISFK